LDRATRWLEIAAKGERNGAGTVDPEADYRLGLAEHDRGHESNAQYYLERAAEHGHLDAAYRMGLIRRDLDDVPAAQHWLDRAAQHGHSEAALELGLLLAELKDREGARYWVTKAFTT
jgi:hypothetical protein